jgi:CcmD family protein
VSTYQAPAQEGAASPKASPTVPTTPDDRGQTFKPVEGASQMQSGEKLLVEAYAAIWLILFVAVLLSWRRQRQLEARVGTLEIALEKARADEAAKKKGGA